MYKSARLLLIAVSACVMSVPAAAEPIYGVFNMGADFGGDKIINVPMDDGSTTDITAGRGLSFAGGVGKTSDDGKYDLQFTFGWKFTGITASNGDIDWTRFPLEGLVFLNQEKLRLGGGLTYHINNSLKGTGVASSLNEKYDNALGFILEGQYRMAEKLLLGARTTVIKYKSTTESANGTSFGVSMTFLFGK